MKTELQYLPLLVGYVYIEKLRWFSSAWAITIQLAPNVKYLKEDGFCDLQYLDQPTSQFTHFG